MSRRKSGGSKTIIALLLIIGAAVAYFYKDRLLRKPEPGPGPVPVEGNLVIRFLNIGQGDSEVIQLPTGQTIVIDSGDRGSTIVEALKSYGVQEIELLIATHPHADHIGEMRDIMRAFKVKELWDAGVAHTTRTYLDMLEERKSKGIKFTKPRRGDTRNIGDARLEVLNPSDNLPDDNINNASIVVRLTYGDTRFLFTGDAEIEAWGQMIDSVGDRLRADLLKAAHHGSSNGMTEKILDTVRPSIVTISCAVGNDYHHPHPRVVSLLKQRSQSIHLYRTDLEGTITAVSDGKKISVTSEQEVASNRLYMTGDEVAGKQPAGESGKKKATGRSSD